MKKVLITTVPYGEISEEPLKLLSQAGLEVIKNPLGRRPTPQELIELIKDKDYLIAGLEQITPEVLDKSLNLKLISRVGVGVDNIPFEETNKRGIKVSYTPDAPTQAVAEICVGLILDCARNFSSVDRDLRNGKWTKHMGVLLSGKTVGIIGLGRIGKTLAKLLKPFNVKILANDIIEDHEFSKEYGIELVTKEEVYERSDFLSINLYCSPEVENMINKEVLQKMKKSAFLINTSRGQVVNEEDLYDALKNGVISGAAIDVYKEEPYLGKLKDLPNIILTAHIGAATKESRYFMELEAAEEVVRFHNGESLKNEISSN